MSDLAYLTSLLLLPVLLHFVEAKQCYHKKKKLYQKCCERSGPERGAFASLTPSLFHSQGRADRRRHHRRYLPHRRRHFPTARTPPHEVGPGRMSLRTGLIVLVRRQKRNAAAIAPEGTSRDIESALTVPTPAIGSVEHEKAKLSDRPLAG